MSTKETSRVSKTSSTGSFSALRWLFLLFILIAAAPSLLSVTGQLPAVVRFVSPRVGHAVSFESASTHWWAPIEIRRITVADLSDHGAEEKPDSKSTPLITANRLVTRQSLWQLAMSFGRGVYVELQEPVVNLRVCNGQTNVEDTFAELGGQSDGSGESFPMVVTVVNGTVRLQSSGLNALADQLPYTTIDGINASLSTLNTTAAMPELMLVANVGRPHPVDIAKAIRGRQEIDPRIAAQLDELAGDFPLIPFTDEEMTSLRTEDAEHTLTVQILPAEGATDVRKIAIEARRLNISELEPIIARLMPNLVCQGTVSCRIQGQLIGSNGTDGLAGRLQLLAENLHLRHTDWAAGESMHFESLTAQGAAAIAKDGILLKHLRVHSSLLDLTGDGEVRLTASTADRNSSPSGEVRLNGRVDLAAMSQMMPQTLHLAPDVNIRKADVRFSAKVGNDTVTAAEEQLLMRKTDFRWQVAVVSSPIEAVRGQQPLKIDSAVRLDAAGTVAINNLEVRQAQLTGSFGTLTANPFEGGYDISGNVNPDRLWDNLKQVINLPRPGINGDVSIATRLHMLPGSIRLSNLKLTSKSLIAESPTLSIYPDRSALEMFNGHLTVEGYGSAIKTIAAPWHNATWLANDTTVAAKFIAAPGENLTLTAVVRPGTLSTASVPNAFQLNEGRLEAGIAVDAINNGFVVERGRIEVPGLTADISGTLVTVDGVLLSNLTVKTQYNLQVLSERFLADQNQNIRLHGNGQETFQISGAPSLWTIDAVARHIRSSPQSSDITDRILPLTITGRVAWSSGDVYQLPLGPGVLVAELKNGLLRTEPIQCTVGSGELNAMPQWDLNANVLQLASGSRLENLQLTPELTKEWLGFVAPVLGDSANVSGTVSCRVIRFDHFIDQPQQSNIQATLTIHNASASPGPSLSPLLQVLEVVGKRQLSTQQMEFPPQDVPFEMHDGMVLHNGLEFGVAGYQVTSSGGVSIDRRIQLALDLPLERSTTDSRGRTIRLPVTGTIDRPQIDTQGLLQNLGRQEIQNRVGDQLDRGLNKLFDKLR